MDAGLSIAVSGLNAERTAIDVVSQNVANAQTPGYVSESVQLAALPGGGTLGVGDGVQVTTISQATNALLSANNNQAQGSLSNLSSLQQVLTGIQNVFPLGQSSSTSSTTASTNSSLAGQLSNFWSAWDAVAQSPSSAAPRTQIVDMAQGLATTLQEASTQLDQLSQNTSAQIASQVSQVNTLVAQAASLNGAIVQTSGGGQSPNQLEDQLNNVVGQLASLAGVNVQMQSNGTAQISVGGVSIVQGDQAASLATSSSGGQVSIVASPGNVAVPVSSGSLAGLLAGLNQYIPQYQSQLDGVAASLATTVNTQLAAGWTAGSAGPPAVAAAPGGPLFVASGGGAVTASSISVSAAISANPALIAAAGPNAGSTGPVGTNDGSNAQALAELGTVSTGPDVAYQNLVEGIGSITQYANTQVSSQTAVANQAQQALSSVTGVNQDTQLTQLMQYQTNYQASAKVVTVIDAAMQSLLAAV
ncbi:MAG: flagellar hook-associated protein FlgK [Actinomycetota bacterium]|nr:flagellar hook-associated protein FlgK [Actinomycetota bacterium]